MNIHHMIDAHKIDRMARNAVMFNFFCKTDGTPANEPFSKEQSDQFYEYIHQQKQIIPVLRDHLNNNGMDFRNDFRKWVQTNELNETQLHSFLIDCIGSVYSEIRHTYIDVPSTCSVLKRHYAKTDEQKEHDDAIFDIE